MICDRKAKSKPLCPDCFKKIYFLYPPLCKFCSKPLKLNRQKICRKCSSISFPYDLVISTTAYKQPLIDLIGFFKYKKYDFLAGFFTKIMVSHLSKIKFNFLNYDLIVSVPMHAYKLKSRGYNQSQLLAQLLSKQFKIPLGNDIIRLIINKPSQTRLSFSQRKENVKGAFLATKSLKGQRVLLIDDIFTTGSTAYFASMALKEKQAGSVSVLTLAKTITRT